MPTSPRFTFTLTACAAALLLLTGAARADTAAEAPAASTAPQAATPLEHLPYTPSLDPSAMDRSVDPCEDLYRYACGNWNRQNPMPADQASWSVYAKMADDNQRYLWGVLQKLAAGGPERSVNQAKLGDYFAACMDDAAADRAGLTPLQPLMAQINALQDKAALPALLAALQLATNSPRFLFAFSSGQDYNDSTKLIAYADAGGVALPERDYYLRSDFESRKLLAAYRAHVTQMFARLGQTPAQAARSASAVLATETALARASLRPVDRRDPYKIAHAYDAKALQALTPHFDWSAYRATLGLPADLNAYNVTEPAFFQALDQRLASISLDDLKAYLRWQLLNASAPLLDAKTATQHFVFFGKTLLGAPEQPPRWKRCVRLIDTQLGEALGQEFVRENFSPELKDKTREMTREIEVAMAQSLDGLTWMSEATKVRAREKLHAIVNKVGYPDKWRDYSALEVSRTDFVGNVQRGNAFEFKRQLAKIGKPLERGEWEMTPQTVDAYYDAQMNDINFPAGVLQPPLFDAKLDDAPNYGNTGGTIGHELTHGFDDEGRQFDAQGNLKNWWTPSDAKAFEQRASCVVKQYGGYTVVDDIKINSRLTLGEDLADLGGLILAFSAWKAHVAGMTLQPQDGLTPEQRFFVGFAQWDCGAERPEFARVHARTDPHSPGRYRINGVVVNMPEFQQAFACKPGQKMTQPDAERCKVW